MVLIKSVFTALARLFYCQQNSPINYATIVVRLGVKIKAYNGLDDIRLISDVSIGGGARHAA
jgi:hypothetical protein